jgi:hypothetical protein
MGRLACLILLSAVACTTQAVDPGLVGTWQLRTPTGVMTWEIGADGTYRIEAGGTVVHAGTFRASGGRWSLTSPTWGEDGGTYRLTDNTFEGTGKLGPATWTRVGAAPAPTPATVASTETLTLSTRTVDGQLVAEHLPELLAAATRRARAWRADAVPVGMTFEDLNAPNPAMRGPQIKVSFLSPATENGFQITVNQQGSSTFEFRQRVNWGTQPVPPVFVDLPAVIERARRHGMNGSLSRADLRVWNPTRTAPILAWTVRVGAAGQALNGANGEIIDFDVTGYIAAYNAQAERAARALRALLHRGSRNRSAPLEFGGGAESPGSQTPAPDVYTDEDYRREVTESAAYWGGNPGDYARIKNGECSWSDNSRYGC